MRTKQGRVVGWLGLATFCVAALVASGCAGAPPAAGAPDEGCGGGVLPEGTEQRWRGEWTSEGWTFDYVLHLTRRGREASGFFEWTLRVAGDTEMSERVGQSAREDVRGALDARTCTVSLAGTQVSDDTLIATDRYELTLAADGTLGGRTQGHGAEPWAGRITGTRAP